MSSIQKTLTLAAPIEQVWAALTDPASIMEWMLDEDVRVDLRVGGHYSLFDRETSGAFIAIEAPNLLEYTWRQRNWPGEWGDSRVRWVLEANGSYTHVSLLHDHFPNEDELVGHDEGWDLYWLGPMRDWLEEDATE